MTEVNDPHDGFFKEVFSKPETAADFVLNYLPASVSELLDTSTLALSKDTFVDQQLGKHFADLLYTVKKKTGEDVLVYVLFEHKSQADPLIAFQLLRYMVRIWKQSMKEYKPKRLLPIIPVVVYHGQEKWNAPLDFVSAITGKEGLEEHLLNFTYHFTDVSRLSDDAIVGKAYLRAALLLLKGMQTGHVREYFVAALKILSRLEDDEHVEEFLAVCAGYINTAEEGSEMVDIQEVIDRVYGKKGFEAGSLAEKWYKEGEEQGKELGKQEGREATLKMLVSLLEHRAVELPSELQTRIAKLDMRGITELFQRSLTVASADELRAILAEVERSIQTPAEDKGRLT